jgi:hypothetical protein
LRMGAFFLGGSIIAREESPRFDYAEGTKCVGVKPLSPRRGFSVLPLSPHGLRRGLHSSAASWLEPGALFHRPPKNSGSNAHTQSPTSRKEREKWGTRDFFNLFVGSASGVSRARVPAPHYNQPEQKAADSSL